jgi:hypothetical protein
MIAQTRSRLGRRLAWLAVVGLATAALFAPSSTALAGQPDTIDICHSTGSDGNPYVVNSPSKDGDVSGHADHTGPVWFDGITVEWGDIIPPFTFDGGSFPGLNWTAEGQAIFENGCNIPDPTPPPTLAPTPTPTEAPTPTPTEAPTPTPAEPTPTGGVGGATGTPAGGAGGATADPTLPSTSTIDGQGSGPIGDGWRVILLTLAGVLAAALLLTPAKAVIRKDDHR